MSLVPTYPDQLSLDPPPDIAITGEAAWADTYSVRVEAWPTLNPILAFGPGPSCPCGDQEFSQTAARKAVRLSCSTSRFNLRLFVPPDALAVYPDLELGIFTGWGCDADVELLFPFHPTRGGVLFAAQVSGQLSSRWELRARITPAQAAPKMVPRIIVVHVELDRTGGGGWQANWNADKAIIVAPTFPPGAAAALFNIFP